MPQLSELLKNAGIHAEVGKVEVTSITTDSRQVKPGALFIAVPGATVDGSAFVGDAVKAGAVAVVAADGAKVDAGNAALVRVADVRAAVGAIAAVFYPRKPVRCYAITGTDGKTSTAEFVRQLSELVGRHAASIGTLGLRMDAQLTIKFPALNTSPEPILLHQTLHQLGTAGITDVALETSSHGLDQQRAAGVKFVAGAFTNIARDHLDYHHTVEAYFEAKTKLFSELLPEGATAVINRDDAKFGELAAIAAKRGLKVTSFGTHAEADLRIAQVTPTADGLIAGLNVRGKTHQLSLPFYGAFQLMNMLAAVGLLEASGVALSTLIPLLPKLYGVPGRLEKIALSKQGAPVFIDYAHTPAALENILKTLRPHTAKKLHVVFGCGGDRDAGKRPEMGRVAVTHADHVIVTDDNPRSENPAAIRAAIIASAPGAQEIPNRDTAIRTAVRQLQSGDVLVVAGKGHETTQIIGTQTLPFNDADHIREAVAA